MRVKYSLKWLSKFFWVINKNCLFCVFTRVHLQRCEFLLTRGDYSKKPQLELLGPACSHWPKDIKKQTLFLLGKLWWHSFSRLISWDKNALVGHSGGYSLKRLGNKATLDLFYSLCYTVITHSPKSHILSLGNSYKKRAPCSEHHHKYFVTQTEKTYNKYHEQENWLCYWLQKF